MTHTPSHDDFEQLLGQGSTDPGLDALADLIAAMQEPDRIEPGIAAGHIAAAASLAAVPAAGVRGASMAG